MKKIPKAKLEGQRSRMRTIMSQIIHSIGRRPWS